MTVHTYFELQTQRIRLEWRVCRICWRTTTYGAIVRSDYLAPARSHRAGGEVSTSTSSIVFTDVVGSTALRARLGEDAADRLFRDHERLQRDVVTAHNGRVVKSGGDGVMASFDSATDAVRAAIGLQQRSTRRFPELRIRVGIASGDVSWEDDDCFGMPVVTAARLQGSAEGGHIVASALVVLLAGERSGAHFRSLGFLDLAGLTEPAEAFEVEWEPLEELRDADGSDVALPGPLSSIPVSGFVGRDREWSELSTAWRAVSEGQRRVILVGGEAGAGKTRLAFEFARWCATNGATVVLGVCDAELTLPCQPWVQILDQLVRAMPSGVLTDLSDDLAEISVLVPQLERAMSAPRRARTDDPQTERYRLFHSVTAFLAAVTAERALVVVIDDLHWADTQTLALLRHVAGSGELTNLLVIGTFRDTSDEITEPLAGCLADLRRVDTVNRVRVTALDRPSVSQLLASAVGHELDADLAALASVLADRSGGNAFYVSELWRHLVANETVVQVDGRWIIRSGAGSLDDVPDSVREVVTQRLAKLSAGALYLLGLAAIAGFRVEFRVLVEAVDGTQDEISDTLDELINSKFLVEIGGPGVPSYEFVHAIVRETVERTVASSSRARLHRSLGEAMEAVHQPDLEPVLADLARHFVASARLGSEARALHYSRRAAAQAVRSGTYDAAVAHLEAARELAGHGTTEAIDVLLELGDARSRAGDIASSGIDFAAAFNGASRAGSIEQAGRAALGFGESQALWGVHSERSVDLTRASLALLDDKDNELRIRLQASLARALALVGDRSEEARHVADEAVAAARRLGDDPLLLYCLICKNHTIESDAVAYLENAAKCRELALRLGDAWRYTYALHIYSRGTLYVGRIGDSAAAARTMAQVAGRERFVLFAHYAECHEVLLALLAGRFDEAERRANETYERGLSIGIESAQGVYGVHMYAVRREQGRLREVAPIMRSAAKLDPNEPVWRPGLAALYAEIGMLDDARHEFASMAPGRFEAVPRDSMWPCSLTFLAEVCVALGDLDQAQVLYDELQPFRGLTMMAAFTMNFGPAERLMGGLAVLLGRRAEAEHHFQAALELADLSGSPVWIARTQLEWATALGDREDLRAAAHSIAVELGMASLAERAKPVATPKVSCAVTLPDGLSAREAEVLDLVAKGLSNREVGTRLFISSNTVANHVRTILQKTGCTNRTEAAAYAVRNRIVRNRPEGSSQV